ncbi:MAG: UDP-2,3-diacylglucosamine diphosphatase [Gammaproteobacteria bacterium]|nr:UDP-2,3-diacylglucosamine diphosphatase [Gammaproteobacteria bacterium]
MPSSLIIADLHLVSDEVDKTNLFIKFCQEQASQVDQLFILGDLFNTWLGDDLSLNDYPMIISGLKTLSTTTKIFIMTGNRDFLLGDEFTKQTGVTLIDSPYLLEFNTEQYLLTHGDELCTDDKDYQRLKSILQHPITQFIFLRLPKITRLKLAGKIRKQSVEAQQYKTREIMDVNPSAVMALMQKYPDTNLIHGHTHRRNTHVEKKFTRYVLGDWASDKGNAIKLDGELSWLEVH